RYHARHPARVEQSPLSRGQSVHPDSQTYLSVSMDALAAVYGEGSEVDGGARGVHGSAVADAGHNGVWGEFTEERLSARSRHSSAVLDQAALQSHSAWSSADDCQRLADLVRQRACGGGAGRDAVGRTGSRLLELDRME